MYMKSNLFKKALTYIKNQNYDAWFILSAKHGLLHPETIIEPYDETLNNANKHQLIVWSEKVYKELCKINLSHVDFYCGDKYRKYLIPLLIKNEVICNVPLKGLGLGQQLQFFTKGMVD
jgi:hypothetical protein